MDVQEEIAKQVGKLPADAQTRVLQFAASLSTSEPVGDNGADYVRYAGYFDAESLREMAEAIEQECERVDASEW